MKALLFSVVIFFIALILFLVQPLVETSWFGILSTNLSPQEATIFQEIRIPELVSSIVAGSALAICGLIMQTFLNNFLASPSILGISAASNTFVAIAMLGTGGVASFLSDIGIVLASTLGACIYGFFLLLFARRLSSSVSLLLVGLMLGSLLSALNDLLINYANAEDVKAFSIWTFGSLRKLNLEQVPLFVSLFIVGTVLSVFLLKPLNLMLLGENLAVKNGLNYQRTLWKTLITVGLLSGIVTAFCGPIAFIGLIIPNLVRWKMNIGNHFKLIPICVLMGASFLVFCSVFIRLIEPWIHLPINVLTSIIGAPIVVFMILKNKLNA